MVAFLGLGDLVRSKETEREDDWRDVALLEEILDERNLAADPIAALCELRSRRGYEEAERLGRFARLSGLVDVRPQHLIAAAYLAPYRGGAVLGDVPAAPPAAAVELLQALRQVTPGTARHLALVEVARRLHKRARMDADRADKERAANEI
jgi:hypothetical protein